MERSRRIRTLVVPGTLILVAAIILGVVASYAPRAPSTRIAAATEAASGTLFSDGFETGDLSNWLTTAKGGGLASVQGLTTYGGTHAARLSETASAGSRAYGRRLLLPGHPDLFVEGAFNVQAAGAAGSNVPILRLFDSSGNRIINLYRANRTGRLYVQHSGPHNATTATIPLGVWRHYRLHVSFAGPGNGAVEVWVDGASVYQNGAANLGSAALAVVQIGDEAPGQQFDLIADEIAISVWAALAQPTAATTLADGAVAGEAP